MIDFFTHFINEYSFSEKALDYFSYAVKFMRKDE